MSSVASPDDPFALQMLFVDEEGGRIEATVQKHIMHKFSNSIVEGQVYRITRFGILRNGGHDFKIIFNSNTQVIACPDIDIPLLGLALTKTSNIKRTRGFSDYLLDFMGIVTAISEETKLNKEGRVTRLMSIDLVDEMGEIQCAIFGNLMDTVKGYLTEPRCGLLVIIIQLAKFNVYKGQVGIQNVMNASKIWWNPDIPQAVEFKNGLAVHEIESDLAISIIPEKPRPVSLREEFLEMYPKKSVRELNQLLEEGSFIILGTITEILDDSLWWYMACTCMKSVTYELGFPFCTGCNIPVYNITPRYKIKLAVTNGEDITHLIMFDSECRFLLDKSCYDLLEEGKVNGCSGYPQEIMDFVGKELLYRVEINEDAMLAYDGCIKVKKLCSDSSIISDYKERVDDETPLKVVSLLILPSFKFY
ncbi:hypothetical protein SESBI_00069 [Sesbania bispinosa]|nr:hypothetical protein SESBI_00069 [Sesbania bispinosa]